MNILDRTTPPPAKAIEDIQLAQASSIKLDNKIPLHVINTGKQDVLRLELVFKAGHWFEPKEGVALFTFKMLNEGTKNKSAKDINNYIDQFGSFLDLEPSMDYCTLTLYTLPKHLDNLLPLIKELVYESNFPQEELETFKSIRIQKIRINEQKNNIVASHKFRETLFGRQHPYGRTLSVEAAQSIQREDLVNFHKDYIIDNFEIILSGKVSEENINSVNKTFGQHQVHTYFKQLQYSPEGASEKVLVEKAQSLQSSIRIGKILFTKSHPDYLEMLMVNEILGGYFGSRLMKNIREDKGFTYGISSSILSLKNEGFFILGTDVKKEFTEQTLEEIYKEIQILRNDLVEEEELNTVKNYMLGSFLSSINTPFAIADKFKAIYFNDLDYSYYHNYIKVINNITSKRIQELANQYLNPDSLTEVVIGGYK
jgi:zinc protease